MSNCETCKKKITDGNLLQCPNCGKTVCSTCGEKTKMICPKCYSNLEYYG